MSRLPDQNGPTYKIVVIGNGNVGKSALTIQYFQNKFPEEHDPTIEDSYMQHKQIDGQWCLMDVLDTAGQAEYNAMRENYMRKGNGFIIVFDVTDRSSFEAVHQFQEDIYRIKDTKDFPTIIIGNKIDLKNYRKVLPTEGIKLAEEMQVPYIETSAKTRHNLDEAFETLVRLIRIRTPIPPVKPEKGKKKKCTIL